MAAPATAIPSHVRPAPGSTGEAVTPHGTPVSSARAATTLRSSVLPPGIVAEPWTSAPTGEGAIQLLAQMGGTTNGMALAGDVVFLTVGPRVVAVDVSDPRAPIEVGRSDVLGAVLRGLVVHGDHLYVIVGDRLVVIDVRNPAQIRAVSSLPAPDWPVDLGVAGDVLVVASLDHEAPERWRTALWFVDVGEPEAPRMVARLAVPSRVVDVAVTGKLALVLNEAARLRVVRFDEPAHPVEVADLPIPRGGHAGAGWIEAVGDEAYVSVGPNRIYRLHLDPVGDFEQVAGELGSASRLWAVRNGLLAAYTITREILDDRSFLSTYTLPDLVFDGLFGAVELPAFVTSRGEYLFLASWEGGLRVVARSESIPKLEEVAAYDPSWSANDVAVSSGRAFIAAGDDGGGRGPGGSVHVIDVRQPARPRAVAALRVPAESRKAEARAIALDGDTLYVGCDWENGRSGCCWAEGPYPNFASLHVVDVRDPEALHELGRFDQTDAHCGGSNACGPFGVRGLAADGRHHALLLYGRGGLATFDVADPTAPRTLRAAETDLWSGVASLALDPTRRLAYVVGGGTELSIIDVSDTTSVREIIYSHELGGSVVAVEGQHAYVVGGDAASEASRMRVLDVEDPSRPTPVGSLGLPGWAEAAVARRGLLVVATSHPEALHAIDVSSPEAPVIVATYPLHARRLALSGSELYAASEYEGLYILHLDPPAMP